MTPDRFARYDRALAAAGCDLFVSASTADVHYLTGSEDGNAFVVYCPGDRPTIVVRASGFNCVVASAQAKEVIAFTLADDPIVVLADEIRQRRPRRVAVGPVSSDVAEGLRDSVDDVAFLAEHRLGRDVRRVKEPEEIRVLEAAAACVGAGIQACFEAVQLGISDREAAGAACAAARRSGADSIAFVQVKSGPRGAFPDAEEVGRPFGPNEIGFIDLGVVHRFYRGDYTRAFVIGDPPAETRRIVEVVDQIQREALTMLRPGLRCRDYYHTVHQMFAEAGYPDALPHHLGHGLGIGDDFVPRIIPTSEDVFVEGEVVCVEPGVYVPGVGGVRIEDTVVVRTGGNQVLSRAARVGYCR